MKSKVAYMVFFGLIVSKGFAQPNAVEYKDGSQVLSGLSIVPAQQLKGNPGEIGRASCRERVCLAV